MELLLALPVEVEFASEFSVGRLSSLGGWREEAQLVHLQNANLFCHHLME